MGEGLEKHNDFLNTIKKLNNPAVLLRKEEDGTYKAVFASEMFAKLMECSVDEAIALMDGKGVLSSVHQDDRIFIKRMFRRRKGEDGTTELTVRKYTAKGNLIWCRLYFTFIDDYDAEYVFCTHSDVTALKEYEQQLRISYKKLGDNFYHFTERTLGVLRADLTLDKVEDIQGKDIYSTDTLEILLPFLKRRNATGKRSMLLFWIRL